MAWTARLLGLGLLMMGLMVVGLLPAPAVAASCPGERRPVTVEFSTRFDTASLDHTRRKEYIHGLFIKQNALNRRPHGGAQEMAVGLTATQSQFGFNTNVQVYRREGGGYCAYLRSVESYLNQIDTKVYVSRDFPRHSCAYEVTYAHEKKHVGIYYFTQKDFAPRIEARLRDLVSNTAPRVVGSVEEARRVHAREINAGMQPILDALEAERTRRNGMLDTPENYAREQAKCDNWY
ncbi:hypothetical protein [Roseospira navarrensis]|uniref:DUF922 domain-containing protein n=1 Tax=Roseospira navarrensis TaxID=140058 RepID=A0A7X2D334_9PROT|nr:hypothetical protein [Roseospira navarrensis]MQX35167.1 hypothetical protein [Roseospira navarrensis]